MRTVFADSFYFFGLLNRADNSHGSCRRFTIGFRGRLVTTEYVLLELADGFASPRLRQRTAQFIQHLRASATVSVVPASTSLLVEALALYESRTDKPWSLTDCTSFVAMKHAGLVEALTGDRHFQQAGFTALLSGAEETNQA